MTKAHHPQQRANTRIAVSMATRIRYQGEDMVGIATNLSPGGVLIDCHHTVAVGKTIELGIALGDGKSPAYLPVTGTIRHTRGGIGIKFDTLSPAALVRIITTLVKISMPQRSTPPSPHQYRPSP